MWLRCLWLPVPLCRPMARPGLSQVKAISIVTNRRMIEWGPEVVYRVCNISNTNPSSDSEKVTEITWEFNAMFDRIRLTYQID
jgi:hypothetical protein